MAHAARSTLAVTLFSLGLIASAAVGACSGGEFSSDVGVAGSGGKGPDAGSGAGAGAAGSTSGSGGGGTVLCRTPLECDDNDPCTLDECGAEGSCLHSAKCGPGELCCDGDCGQCCAQDDCNDDVECTTDQCFNFYCAFAPDDAACGANQYCHRSDDCRDREQCPNGTVEECDDSDPCTTDSCNGGLCYHDDCGGGLHCCADGCAECCGDEECSSQAGDSCSKGVCLDGKCGSTPLCSDTELCCAGAGQVTCAECCEPADCADDGIECTEASCLGGVCSHTPNDILCSNGGTCDPEQGCVAGGGCQDDDQCLSPDPCSKGTCDMGTCVYSELCPGQHCCAGICADCCSRDDCTNIANAAAAGPVPPDGCESVSCVEGSCLTAYLLCTEVCCAPNGCCSLDI
jgi:hypothetical protein